MNNLNCPWLKESLLCTEVFFCSYLPFMSSCTNTNFAMLQLFPTYALHQRLETHLWLALPNLCEVPLLRKTSTRKWKQLPVLFFFGGIKNIFFLLSRPCFWHTPLEWQMGSVLSLLSVFHFWPSLRGFYSVHDSSVFGYFLSDCVLFVLSVAEKENELKLSILDKALKENWTFTILLSKWLD